MMNEGQYIALRNYAEEHSSLLRQILEELKAQNKPQEPATFTLVDQKGNEVDAAPGEVLAVPAGANFKPKAAPKKGK